MSRGFSILKWPCFHNNNKRIENLKIFPGHQSYYSLQMHRQHTSKLKKKLVVREQIYPSTLKRYRSKVVMECLCTAHWIWQFHHVISTWFIQCFTYKVWLKIPWGGSSSVPAMKAQKVRRHTSFFLHWFYIQHCHREQERELNAWIVWQFIQSRPFCIVKV